MAALQSRVRVRVEGTVQGVGFRPHVYRLAQEESLAGWVLNDERGVLLEVEGDAPALERFLARLSAEAPPLADVERVRREQATPSGERGFAILHSERAGLPEALVSPDSATCAACLEELLDPDDRRYRYPFTNCTDCGPRFTIVRGVPYDRPLTTMAGFELCARCRAEYDDPGDRRFHAQPNACPVCGPRVRLLDAGGAELNGDEPLAVAARGLGSGLILALKGLGGYHLACRADDEAAASALRARKQREDRPFALMAADVEATRELVQLTPAEEALVRGRERPIVIARRRPGVPVAPSVAPRSPDLGVMLPYTPLHHLLLRDVGQTLVMTSGNVSDEPIAYDDSDALARLQGIADLFLVHDRPIHVRADDSVLRSLGALREAPLMLRRSRGYVPASIDLPLVAPRPLLACGAELKSTFCLAKGRRAWVSHHIGDLKNYETLRSFEDGVEHFERLFAVEPEVVAHDLHPDYLSTGYALRREGVETVAVQHHHAHLAACLAEHGEEGPAVGAIYDGTGYGEDGTVWGGELLVGGLGAYERTGSLLCVPMPGGERAVQEPWRMACAWLIAAGDGGGAVPPASGEVGAGGGEVGAGGGGVGAADPPPLPADREPPPLPAVLEPEVDAARWRQIADLARSGFASPLTSSMGRLFDAAAALCGLRASVTYEGQAAIELEAVADVTEYAAYPFVVSERPPRGIALDPRETVRALAADAAQGVSPATIAARFHNAVADATARACAQAAEAAGTTTVVLSGGVFANRLLVERLTERLERRGLRWLLPERLPPGDGGIAYGQAAVAAARLRDA